MWFLKDLQEFEKFKADNISSIVNEPEAFPCFAYFIVTDWGMEEDTALYLYITDIREMLEQCNSVEKRKE